MGLIARRALHLDRSAIPHHGPIPNDQPNSRNLHHPLCCGHANPAAGDGHHPPGDGPLAGDEALQVMNGLVSPVMLLS